MKIWRFEKRILLSEKATFSLYVAMGSTISSPLSCCSLPILAIVIETHCFTEDSSCKSGRNETLFFIVQKIYTRMHLNFHIYLPTIELDTIFFIELVIFQSKYLEGFFFKILSFSQNLVTHTL